MRRKSNVNHEANKGNIPLPRSPKRNREPKNEELAKPSQLAHFSSDIAQKKSQPKLPQDRSTPRASNRYGYSSWNPPSNTSSRERRPQCHRRQPQLARSTTPVHHPRPSPGLRLHLYHIRHTRHRLHTHRHRCRCPKLIHRRSQSSRYRHRGSILHLSRSDGGKLRWRRRSPQMRGRRKSQRARRNQRTRAKRRCFSSQATRSATGSKVCCIRPRTRCRWTPNDPTIHPAAVQV